MKKMNLKLIGIGLVVVAFLTAAAIQLFTHGLVVTDQWHGHIQESDPRIVLTGMVKTTYHMLRILLLLATALIGVLCILVSRRHDTPVV
jgi:hypothetical protein